MKSASPLAYGLLRDHARERRRRDLTIIPMLDVMVILAFFLIFTAVFSRTNILEMHLPGPGAAASADPAAFELEVIVRRAGLEVAERGTGILATIPATGTGQDVVRLSRELEELKRLHPQQHGATLLIADDVDYDTIVQVMDAVSVRQVVDGSQVLRTELFPQISLGDAPT
jgi:biopolymer transport protein ExbD